MLRFAIALALTAGTANADTLLVISTDPAFASAVDAAVSPDKVSVRSADLATPSLETIAVASRDATTREHADAAAWLVFAGGSTLIVYDRTVDRMLVRSLPYASPLDAAQAAEAGRVTRTMLRALRIAEVPMVRPPPPVAVVVTPPPPPPPPRPGVLAVELDGGVRVRGPGATAGPLATLGVIWHPDRLGLAVALRLAPAAELDGAFVGQISDHSLAATLRLPLRAARRTEAIATAGLALHRVALEGMLDGSPRVEVRFDPAARFGIAGLIALGPAVRVGASVSVDWLLRRQAYAAGETQVLSVPPVQVGVGLVLVARIL